MESVIVTDSWLKWIATYSNLSTSLARFPNNVGKIEIYHHNYRNENIRFSWLDYLWLESLPFITITEEEKISRVCAS